MFDLPPLPDGKSCTFTGNCSNCVTHPLSFATNVLNGEGATVITPL